MSYCNHRIRNCDLPVREDVCCCIKELSCNLVEHLTLERNSLREDYVKCRDTVRYYHYKIVVADAVNITNLTYIVVCLARKREICLYNCFHLMLF